MNVQEYLSNPLGHERFTTPVLSTNRNPIIFDIGACDGLDSIRYAKMFALSRIYSFEPEPKNYQLLIGNTNEYSNVTAVNVAMGAEQGLNNFYSSYEDKDQPWDHGNKSGSLLRPDEHLKYFPNIKFREGHEVEVTTVDKFCELHNLSVIDLMHIDVQGAELEVLKGSFRMLNMTKFIWLEVSNVTLYKDQPLRNDIETYLRESGYRCIVNNTDGIYGDQLYYNYSCEKELKKDWGVYLRMKIFLNGLFQN